MPVRRVTYSPTTGSFGGGGTVIESVELDFMGQVVGITTAAVDASGSGVSPTRRVDAGNGLTGGGDLSADRTIAMPSVMPAPGTFGGGSTFINRVVVDAYGRVLQVTGSVPATGSSGAPTDATYIVQSASDGLSAEQSLGDLTTGLLKNTVTMGSGILSTAIAGTDYQLPLSASMHYVTGSRRVDTDATLTGGGRLDHDLTLGMPSVMPAPGATGGGTTFIQKVVVDSQGRLLQVTGSIPATGSFTNWTGISNVDRGYALSCSNPDATNETDGIEFYVTTGKVITGARFYWAPAGAKVVRVSLFSGSGVRLATTDVSCSAPGFFTATFTASIDLTNRKYHNLQVGMWQTDHGGRTTYVDAPGIGHSLVGDYVFHRYVFGSTDVQPTNTPTTERYPIEPTFQ